LRAGPPQQSLAQQGRRTSQWTHGKPFFACICQNGMHMRELRKSWKKPWKKRIRMKHSPAVL
jgi:hypothetical protein